MTTINVGFDFDEPMYPWYDLAHKASVKAGLVDPDLPGPLTWAPHEHYGCTLEEWVAVLDNEVHNGDMYVQPLKPGVKEEMVRLHRRGYGIHIITARGQFGESGERIKEITKTCLIREGIPYETLNFAKNKIPVCQELNIDYMIDDAPHNFDPLVEAGINAFLLDERWNRDHPEKFLAEGGRRVHDLHEFVKHVIDETCVTSALTPRQQASVSRSLAQFGRV